MKTIPIEFMPGFWVSLPIGLEGNGSGFLLAENIKSVFSIECPIVKSADFKRSWSIINMTNEELKKNNYLNAIVQIILESWIESKSIIIVGSEVSIIIILKYFLRKFARINDKYLMNIIMSKIGD